ncbi:MAG: hypothetical protein KKA60_05045 [Proteobacteria bacterium]|nr:hypothetical protein [Pseudomonadota bacterium]
MHSDETAGKNHLQQDNNKEKGVSFDIVVDGNEQGENHAQMDVSGHQPSGKKRKQETVQPGQRRSCLVCGFVHDRMHPASGER